MNFNEKFNYLSKLIGKTPIIKIIANYKGKTKEIFAKCEWYNLSGSIKDRAALNMLKNSNLTKDSEIVEVTSGNMGISLACIGAFLNLKVSIFMPQIMSDERKKLIKLYGANLNLCKDFSECFELAKKYSEENKNVIYTKQFENIYNKEAQKEIGKEILSTCNIDAFVSGVGTSGTLSGVGSVMKENGKKVIAIDPSASSLLTLGYSKGNHKIQGLSDGVIPKLYEPNIVDNIIPISDEDAIAMAQKLNSLGLSCGISGGANFLGSILCSYDKVATIFPDDNKKYLSTDLSKNITTSLVNEINIKI